ncbi:hypothetical protein ACFLSP_05040, partial [Bacteroidota bacterium]
EKDDNKNGNQQEPITQGESQKSTYEDKYKIYTVKKQSEEDDYAELVSQILEMFLKFNVVETVRFLDYQYDNCDGDKEDFLTEVGSLIRGDESLIFSLQKKDWNKNKIIENWIVKKSMQLPKTVAIDSLELSATSHKFLLLYELGVIDYLKQQYPKLDYDTNTIISKLLGAILEVKSDTLRNCLNEVGTGHKNDPITKPGVNKVKSVFSSFGIEVKRLPDFD